MVLALAFLIACILHHPQTGQWVIAAIALWGGERLFRLIYTIYINGIIGMRRLGVVRSRDTGYYRSGITLVEEWSEKEKSMMSRPGDEVEILEKGAGNRNSRRRSYYAYGPGHAAKV